MLNNKEITKRVEILSGKVRFWQRSRLQEQLKALEEIGNIGSPFDVQYICRFIFSDNEAIAKKASTIIRKLYAETLEAFRQIEEGNYQTYSLDKFEEMLDDLNKK